MKRLFSITAVLALAACSNLAPNDPPAQVVSGQGAIKVTASGLPVTSGNHAAIPPGQPGSGGESGSASR